MLAEVFGCPTDMPCEVVRSFYQGRARSGYVWNIECSRHNRTWAINFRFDDSIKLLRCSAVEVVVKVRCVRKANLPW